MLLLKKTLQEKNKKVFNATKKSLSDDSSDKLFLCGNELKNG